MMKKLIAVILSLALLVCAATAAAEAAEDKITLGTLSINGAFRLQCGLPDGYSINPGTVTPDMITASLRSEDPAAPVMQLSVAYDEMYADVDRLNDLDEEALKLLEQTFIDNDPDVEITYGETGYGTLLLIAAHQSETLDYITFFSIYKGYCVEFALVPPEQAEDKNLTEEQMLLSVDFLTELDFIPANVSAGSISALADGQYVTRLTDYDPETNTVRAEVMHTVTLPEAAAEALKPGDTLTLGAFSGEIASLEKTDEGEILINDEIHMVNYGGEYHVYFSGKEYLETFAVLTLPIPDELVFMDYIDPATGEESETAAQYTADEFRVYAAFGADGELLLVERFGSSWQ